MKFSEMVQELARIRGKPLRYQNQAWLKDVYLRSTAGTITIRTGRSLEKTNPGAHTADPGVLKNGD